MSQAHHLRCPSCAREVQVGILVDPSLCPECFAELEVAAEPGAQATAFTAEEWLALQQHIWREVSALTAPPERPLTREHLKELLQNGAEVDGELEEATGRFYLRSILLPGGSALLVGTSEGKPCIFQHRRKTP